MTLDVDNIWYSYLKHWVCQILLFLAAFRSQIECPLFAEYHWNMTVPQVATFDLCVYSAIHTSNN